MSDIQPTYVRFPRDLHDEVKAYAAANDLSMAQVIRHATRSFIAGPSVATTTVINNAVAPDLRRKLDDAVKDGMARSADPSPPEVHLAGCTHPKKVRGDSGIVTCKDCGKPV